MTLADDLRTMWGLSTDVVSDSLMDVIIRQAQSWCDAKASAYHVTAPDSAVVAMAEVYLRRNLDLRGIKPSSINMPDLSMSTDLNTVCGRLEEEALTAIKSVAYSKGAAVKHIRSGKVHLRWH